jgi:hypothetical protein
MKDKNKSDKKRYSEGDVKKATKDKFDAYTFSNRTVEKVVSKKPSGKGKSTLKPGLLSFAGSSLGSRMRLQRKKNNRSSR